MRSTPNSATGRTASGFCAPSSPRQCGVARHVEAQVGGDDRGERQRHRHAAEIDFAGDFEPGVRDGDGRRRRSPAASRAGRRASGRRGCCRRRPPACRAGSGRGFSSATTVAQELCDRQRLDLGVGLDQDAAMGAHRERGEDHVGRLLRPDRDDDDLGRVALLRRAAPRLRPRACRTGSSTCGRCRSRRPVPSGRTRMRTVWSTTRLTATRIFMAAPLRGLPCQIRGLGQPVAG